MTLLATKSSWHTKDPVPKICGSRSRMRLSLRTFPWMNVQVSQIWETPIRAFRAAADPRTGAVYALYGNPIGTCVTPVPIGQAVELEYKLNRSTDGGKTWSFGNQPLGTVVAQACSDQGVTFNSYSFGVPEPGNPQRKSESFERWYSFSCC